MSRVRAERVIRSAYAARVRGDLDAIMTHLPKCRISPSISIVEGDRAAVQARVLLRPVGGGAEVDTEIVDLFRLEGERIASMRQFADTALAAELLKR